MDGVKNISVEAEKIENIGSNFNNIQSSSSSNSLLKAPSLPVNFPFNILNSGRAKGSSSQASHNSKKTKGPSSRKTNANVFPLRFHTTNKSTASGYPPSNDSAFSSPFDDHSAFSNFSSFSSSNFNNPNRPEYSDPDNGPSNPNRDPMKNFLPPFSSESTSFPPPPNVSNNPSASVELKEACEFYQRLTSPFSKSEQTELLGAYEVAHAKLTPADQKLLPSPESIFKMLK
jgi:hypothetical protein